MVFFEALAKSAQALFGVAYTPVGRRKLLTAVLERQKRLGFESLAEYGALLRREPEEWAQLWPLALAAEGAFLRPSLQFEVARDLLAEWSVMAGDRTLRVLSLGCGAGFEVWSLAMMLEETGLRAKNWQVEIYGLDLNKEAVDRSDRASFMAADLEWLTEAARKKWFAPRVGGFHFKTELAPPVQVTVANAYEPETWPWADQGLTFDLIFCRGLTFEAPPKIPKLLSRILRQSLSDEGFIFTAPGEFLPDSSGEIHLEERSGVTYYRRGLRKIKANLHHVSRKVERNKTRVSAGGEPAETGEQLSQRERALLQQAGQELAEGRAEAARALVNEVMISALDEGRVAASAWAMVAKIERCLGRTDSAAATEAVVALLG